MKNNLALCNMELDRSTALRKNSQWLYGKLTDVNSEFCYFWRGKFLFSNLKIVKHSRNDTKACATSSLDLLFAADLPCTFLGLEQEVAIFAYDLSDKSDTDIEQWLASIGLEKAKFIDFRNGLSLLDGQAAAVLGYAKSLIHWQQSSQYCGFCASPTRSEDGGHRRQCTNVDCGKEIFPRTDPAVIMLVEYQPEDGPAVCLIAEHHRTPALVYSTLAGFVDPGESLTEAVRREVFEEAGLQVDKVTYIDSQPWPFPNSIMVGFLAHATHNDIVIEEEELRSAKWFTAKEIQGFGDWGDDSEGEKMPRKESIARLLIDQWCQKQLENVN